MAHNLPQKKCSFQKLAFLVEKSVVYVALYMFLPQMLRPWIKMMGLIVRWNSTNSVAPDRIALLVSLWNNFLSCRHPYSLRGRPLMIWGGARRKSRKKNFGGPSPGKKNLKGLPPGKKIWKGYREEKINSFSNFPPGPPRLLMVDPLPGFIYLYSVRELGSRLVTNSIL